MAWTSEDQQALLAMQAQLNSINGQLLVLSTQRNEFLASRQQAVTDVVASVYAAFYPVWSVAIDFPEAMPTTVPGTASAALVGLLTDPAPGLVDAILQALAPFSVTLSVVPKTGA